VRDKDIQNIGKEKRGSKRDEDEKVREKRSLGKKLEKKKTLIFNVTNYVVQK
jgi:hypothetical protein